jgi:hypothetical protein
MEKACIDGSMVNSMMVCGSKDSNMVLGFGNQDLARATLESGKTPELKVMEFIHGQMVYIIV